MKPAALFCVKLWLRGPRFLHGLQVYASHIWREPIHVSVFKERIYFANDRHARKARVLKKIPKKVKSYEMSYWAKNVGDNAVNYGVPVKYSSSKSSHVQKFVQAAKKVFHLTLHTWRCIEQILIINRALWIKRPTAKPRPYLSSSMCRLHSGPFFQSLQTGF